MITDSIADLLTRIRNAQTARHKSVDIKKSKMAGWILEILKSEGFITAYSEGKGNSDRGNAFVNYEVLLKYREDGAPMISKAERISKPGRRIFIRHSDINPVQRGLGLSMVSTSQGILTDREARSRKIGGELLLQVY